MRVWSMAFASFFLLGMLVLAGGSPSTPLPQPVLDKLIAQEAKFLQESLAKKVSAPKTARKIKGAALMVAAYAQGNMAKGSSKELATVRDHALRLIKAVDENKLDEAKALAASLSSKAKANPAAKTAPVALAGHLPFEFVMRLFSSERVGGFGMEKEIETLAEMKGPLAADAQDKAVSLAYKVAVLARLAQEYPPEKDEGPKTRKSWSAFADRMNSDALALADAGRANKGVAAAAEKLNQSCMKCHDVFR